MLFPSSSGRRELLRAFLAGLLWMAGNASAIVGDRVDALVAEIEHDLARLGPALGIDGLSPAVRRAIREVPRHAFVPADQRAHAYRNRPLPIGYGQTISQPVVVAAMTELLHLEPGQRVFELGTGSGYQAALLAALGAEVYSVEIVPPLAERARAALDATGYGAAVRTRTGDGYYGWEEAAPFDAVIVTAAGDHVPPPLLEQLKPGGRMVLPIGGRYFMQQLVLVTRQADGSIETRELIDVSFVAMAGRK